MTRHTKEALVLLALAYLAVVLAALSPRDRFPWFFEIVPVFLVTPVLVAAYRRS